jgi:hypothetical protein
MDTVYAGTQAPVRRTTQQPKRRGNPFMVPRTVPAQPVRVRPGVKKAVPA